MVKYLKDENFNELINEKVLVDFYADWCGPCKMLGPVLEEINEIPVVKVNVDTHGELARKYGVMSIPTLVLFENGKEIKRNVGFLDINGLKEFIK